MTDSVTDSAAPSQPSVVLHVGMGKTGTTTIQTMCHRNRERLADHGILYPLSLGRRRHIRLGLAMQDDDGPHDGADWRSQGVRGPSELRPLVHEELRREVAQARPQRLLLSDESLLAAAPEVPLNTAALLSWFASDVRLVVYLRRQDEHVASRYQQAVKRHRETRRLARRVDEINLDHTYDYHARIRGWRDAVAPSAVALRTFERSRLAGVSLEQDFLDAAGLDIPLNDLDLPGIRNESLDAETVEFLRILNLWHVEHDHPPDQQHRGRLVRRLQRRTTAGPTLTLPTTWLDDFMGRWDEGNRALAHELAPDGPDTLFADARKGGPTTTEQRLDPARLEDYLALARLPEEAHDQVRRIAEREAEASS